ncbi:MAG: ABC transporter ATP-binding protein [Armatimonadota bacterium]|nr:ABC transporter ATP-binding protein [Armatimonadota bacterium]MCX7778110.1 ABC transporter ATP-binding protein [Armatimonadota bacterium]MDW8026171.1 ABC transporter ATP-binding protein [Armatimonadota bacterium]
MRKIQLTVSNLHKRYGRNLVLKGVTFIASSGDCVAVVGPNGSGKTTLLKCLCGLLQPNAGNVQLSIGETTLSPTEAQPFIGALFDDCEPYDELTVNENLSLFLSLRECHKWRAASVHKSLNCEPMHPQLEHLLRKFKLDGFANEFVGSLSSGTRQRLKLAMACAKEPLLLLLDEPMANLDEVGRRMVISMVSEMRSKGSIVAWASCDEGEIEDATVLVKLG